MSDVLPYIFVGICFFLWCCLYIPILCVNLRKYRSNQQNIVYLLRYSNITVIQAIIFIIKLVFSVVYMLSSLVFFGLYSRIDQIFRALNAYLAAIFIYCFLWKFWLLRYQILLNGAILNSEWKSGLGNTMCTMWMWLAMAMVFTTSYVLQHIVFEVDYLSGDDNPYYSELVSGWDYAIPFLLCIVIYVKTPSFEDNFYIRKEMKYLFLCLSIWYTAYYSELMVMAMWTEQHGTLLAVCIYFSVAQLVIGLQFAAMMISTFWVNQRCDGIIQSHRYEIHKLPQTLQSSISQQHCISIQPKMVEGDHDESKNKITTVAIKGPKLFTMARSDTFSFGTNTKSQSMDLELGTFDATETTNLGARRRHQSEPSGGSASGTATASTFREGLFELISEELTYNEFIRHLSKEFSIELLLSLTEFIQFRQYMIGQMGDDSKAQLVDQFRVELPANIPQSYIVQNAELSAKDKAFLLYCKYIRNGGEWEINISSELRGHFDSLLGDYDKWISNTTITDGDLVSLFVPCCTQMIYLMVDSRKRFEETPVYWKLRRKLSQKQ